MGTKAQTTLTPEQKAQIKAGVSVVMALAEAIRALGSVPSGTLYARVMHAVSLDQYNAALGVLKRAGLVGEERYMLSWVGPQ